MGVTITWFQSRNRDAFHFRVVFNASCTDMMAMSFNLVIEMLFISGG